MIFHTYEWKKEYKPSSLMKGLELLKEKFEHYQLREGLIQKFHYYRGSSDFCGFFPKILNYINKIKA